MAKKYVELSKKRLLVIEYYWKVDQGNPKFMKFEDKDIIPKELWKKLPDIHLEFVFLEGFDRSNVYPLGDTKLIMDGINSLVPPTDVTVGEYFE